MGMLFYCMGKKQFRTRRVNKLNYLCNKDGKSKKTFSYIIKND